MKASKLGLLMKYILTVKSMKSLMTMNSWRDLQSIRGRVFVKSRAQTPFGKIKKGSGNMTIQCSMLCLRRIQSVMQPCANDYVIMQSKSKVCELYSLCDWIVQQILKCQFFVTLWQQGISLAYE